MMLAGRMADQACSVETPPRLDDGVYTRQQGQHGRFVFQPGRADFFARAGLAQVADVRQTQLLAVRRQPAAQLAAQATGSASEQQTAERFGGDGLRGWYGGGGHRRWGEGLRSGRAATRAVRNAGVGRVGVKGSCDALDESCEPTIGRL